MNERLAGLMSAFDPVVEECLVDILVEYLRARQKHPDWPTDPVHAAAVLGEESGELTQAALQFYYDDADKEDMYQEAVQCGAMSLRFLMHMLSYGRKGRQS
jgi:NTP pyrophosphatase (non-canonical NTP hydrolase)